MVVIVAFLLAFVSSSLKEKQNKNIKQDTMKQILAAINVAGEDADEAFVKYQVKDMLMQSDGSLVENTEAFSISYKEEIADGRLHVFQCVKDGAVKYVIPMYGAGLWGPIWGYIGLNDDKNTVYGIYFSHAGETPGLGAEITNPKFQAQFIDKLVMDGESVELAVVKNGKVTNATYEVDGISGGTITSKGVDAMLKDCLGSYTQFLTTAVAAAEVDADEAETEAEEAATEANEVEE